MTLAKASKEDIKKITIFFQQWDALHDDGWEVDMWDEEEVETLPVKPDSNKRISERDFFRAWHERISYRWMRVVRGCDVLIDNCCDPDKDYLDFKPELKNADVLRVGGEFETEDGRKFCCCGVEPCEDEEGEIDVMFSRVKNEEEGSDELDYQEETQNLC